MGWRAAGARRTLAFELGLLTASVLAVACLATRPGGEERWFAWSGGLLGERQPVLVVLLGDRGRVARVRAAVDPERVIAESPGAFALAERRLVAESSEAVGPLLSRAGWENERLEIAAIGRRRPLPFREPEVSRLTELLGKPTLSLAEAHAVLGLL